ncbi:MAG: NAD(P)H-dependent oxidoreductase [Pseudomonadota bacterium]
MHILRIDASARQTDSVSKQLGDQLVDAFAAQHDTTVTAFDTNSGAPFVDADWIGANFTPADARSDAQRDALAYSDARVAELKAADLVVITTPIYNFGVPATLKAWVDMVARAGLTFRYSENGPVGLLEGKRAVVLATSGGTPIGSDIDFATPYLKHVLGFVGIHDVTVIGAAGLAGSKDPAAVIAAAQAEARALAEAA